MTAMRLAIIGLGDIAKKAYLPVLTEKEGIELILCTRNEDTLKQIASKYRIRECVQTVDELMEKNIDAAIVSTATEGHYETARKLLLHGIHTYIDKPISMNLEESEEIVRLAKKKNAISMVGFNRRFIPMVKDLKMHGKPNMVIMQKNRFASPDFTRRFVVEDFIHVVDTLRFLLGTEVKDIRVEYVKNGQKLDHLVLMLLGENSTAIGIMNRNGGVTEETIEYSTGNEKYTVTGFVETTRYHNKDISFSKFGDWEPTLYKRGFYQMTDHFIDCVLNNETPAPSLEDSLETHRICERIVKMIDPDA